MRPVSIVWLGSCCAWDPSSHISVSPAMINKASKAALVWWPRRKSRLSARNKSSRYIYPAAYFCSWFIWMIFWGYLLNLLKYSYSTLFFFSLRITNASVKIRKCIKTVTFFWRRDMKISIWLYVIYCFFTFFVKSYNQIHFLSANWVAHIIKKVSNEKQNHVSVLVCVYKCEVKFWNSCCRCSSCCCIWWDTLTTMWWQVPWRPSSNFWDIPPHCWSHYWPHPKASPGPASSSRTRICSLGKVHVHL